jgi:hypothetical protein
LPAAELGADVTLVAAKRLDRIDQQLRSLELERAQRIKALRTRRTPAPAGSGAGDKSLAIHHH